MDRQFFVVVFNERMIDDQRRNEVFYFQDKRSRLSLRCLSVFVTIVHIGQQIEAVTGSFDRDGPTNDNNEDSISEVKLSSRDKIDSSSDKTSHKCHTISINYHLYFFPFDIVHKHITNIQLDYSYYCNNEYSSQILGQITSYSLKEM